MSIVQGLPLWADIVLSGAALLVSAYFAGTTLGILTLSITDLQILAKASDEEKERRHASEHPYLYLYRSGASLIVARRQAECMTLCLQRPFCQFESGATGSSARFSSATP